MVTPSPCKGDHGEGFVHLLKIDDLTNPVTQEGWDIKILRIKRTRLEIRLFICWHRSLQVFSDPGRRRIHSRSGRFE